MKLLKIMTRWDVSCVLSACSVAQLCLTLCDPIDCSPPGSLSMEFSRQEYWRWVAISSSRWSAQPKDKNRISCIGRWILYHCSTWEAIVVVVDFMWSSLWINRWAPTCLFFKKGIILPKKSQAWPATPMTAQILRQTPGF